jgi:glycine oxidase
MNIGIAGAGLLGRLLAWRLSHQRHAVTVFDRAAQAEPKFDGHGAAAFSAAGMLSPSAELDHADPQISQLGWCSIELWRRITAELGEPRLFTERGSLLLAHRNDEGSARRVLARIESVEPQRAPRMLDAAQLSALEPAVHGPAHAWLLPGEAQIDPIGTMRALWGEARDARWCWRTEVSGLTPGSIHLADGRTEQFDLVFDVRGTGARRLSGPASETKRSPTLSEPTWLGQLRGVRGETVWLHAPGHGLNRPLRLLHPRHRVYLVPRPNDMVFVGATEIESEDRSEVSLRSAVELLAAAHSVVPALAEARIIRLDRNLRPALPDHLPRIDSREKLVRINGLFRHGWLIAPALLERVLAEHKLAEVGLTERELRECGLATFEKIQREEAAL